MSQLKKMLIVPFFGKLPIWFPQWEESIARLKDYGYNVFVTNDLGGFNARSLRTLGFETPIVPGTGKVWDYRAAFGVMYADLLKGYDFWGTTDLDVVYGNPDHFIPDEELADVDIMSDEKNYIGGHWTLYRNCEKVNTLFQRCPEWTGILKDPRPSGWVEIQFTERAKAENLRLLFKYVQASRDNEGLEFKNGCLFQNGVEVMLSHFKDQKRWVL